MHRTFLLLLAAAGLAGCATTNDSGVVLHGKPDLSTVVPGTPIDKVAALKKPLRKEPITDGDRLGAETWTYEWDLPDDGVNNRMFTSVVVKDGVIVSFREETADKWKQDAQLHMVAKMDSALEDVSSLKATAARYQRVASLRENQNATPYADTLDLLVERTRFIRRDNPLTAGLTNQATASPEAQVAPAPAPVAEVLAVAPAPETEPAPDPSVAQVEPPKTLRQLEAEELRIRADKSLTKKERLRRLHDVWKQQREVMSAGGLAES
jgi:hypothetical protein